MSDLLTPDERAQLKACLTPDARSALLLEWVLSDVRALRPAPEPTPPPLWRGEPWTAENCPTEKEAEALAAAGQLIPLGLPVRPSPEPVVVKRGPGRPRKEAGR